VSCPPSAAAGSPRHRRPLVPSPPLGTGLNLGSVAARWTNRPTAENIMVVDQGDTGETRVVLKTDELDDQLAQARGRTVAALARRLVEPRLQRRARTGRSGVPHRPSRANASRTSRATRWLRSRASASSCVRFVNSRETACATARSARGGPRRRRIADAASCASRRQRAAGRTASRTARSDGLRRRSHR
jgi:hypothetical protein